MSADWMMSASADICWSPNINLSSEKTHRYDRYDRYDRYNRYQSKNGRNFEKYPQIPGKIREK